MELSRVPRQDMESALGKALDRGELELFFQPKADLHNGRHAAGEALLRWRHGDRLGLPAEFIEVAESSGLIIPIGAWVIDNACAHLRAWRDRGIVQPALAVNVSASQFHAGNLEDIVASALLRYGVQASQLELELTESMLMRDPEATTALMHRLKAIGVKLSLDDFGTGYSCFAYLGRFPIDRLKIDQSFVRDMVSNTHAASIVAAIISLSHRLNLQVIAEGVENEAQLAYLRRLGCDDIQGFLFSPPLAEADYLDFCQQDKHLPRVEDGEATERTLLLVDDDPGILSALRRLLHREGYRMLTARDAEEGLTQLALHDVQVVISDQRMPGLSGSEFLTRVKDMHPDCLRIILSGQADMAAVLDAINNGAVYKFLTKPWDDAQLRQRIREAFRLQAALRAGVA